MPCFYQYTICSSLLMVKEITEREYETLMNA